VRIEVGPRDMEKGQVMLVRRDTLEKLPVPEKEAEARVTSLLEDIQASLFHRALAFRKEHTHRVDDYAAFKSLMDGDGGFVESGWCGQASCELRIKDETKATIRVLPLGRESPAGRPCVCCGAQAKEIAVFAKAY
jgi:prolyl-tRNA synthetase